MEQIQDLITVTAIGELKSFATDSGDKIDKREFSDDKGRVFIIYGKAAHNFKADLTSKYKIIYEVKGKNNKVTLFELYSEEKPQTAKVAVVVPMPVSEGQPKVVEVPKEPPKSKIEATVTTFGDATRESIESQKRADLINQAWIAGKLNDKDLEVFKLRTYLQRLEPDASITKWREFWKETPLVKEAKKLGAKEIPKAG